MFQQFRADQFTVLVVERNDGVQEAMPFGRNASQVGRMARRAIRIEDRFATGEHIRRGQFARELRETPTGRTTTASRTTSGAAAAASATAAASTRRRTLGRKLRNQSHTAQRRYQ
jgi:hypothetical protein